MTEELKSCSCERCIRAWSEVERMRNLLEDVVNALDLSEIAVETHGPLGTEPAELVKLVLQQKDREIALLRYESDELPEWAKEKIRRSIINLSSKSALEVAMNGGEAVFQCAIKNLLWILSLRKQEDNSP